MPDSFPPESRYHSVEQAIFEDPAGNEIAYLRRRFVSPPEQFQLLQEHLVVEGDRHDNLAYRYLGDPEQFWRICDANVVMGPEELTETIGKRVRITLPDGFPGSADA